MRGRVTAIEDLLIRDSSIEAAVDEERVLPVTSRGGTDARTTGRECVVPT